MSELVSEAKRLDPDAFVARYPTPVLLFSNLAGSSATERVETPHGTAGPHQAYGRTLVSAPGGRRAPPPESDESAVAYPLTKSDRNPFMGMITVGRARNNDIILTLNVVSKLHISFTPSAKGFRVQDHGSTNGTIIDGRRLQKNEMHEVVCGTLIELGPGVTLRLLSPEALFAHVLAL